MESPSLQWKKSPCGVLFITPHGSVFLSVRAVAIGESNPAPTRHRRSGTNALYRPTRPSRNLGKSCLPTFAGELDFGRKGATSATDVPMLAFTGVNRMAWMSPV